LEQLAEKRKREEDHVKSAKVTGNLALGENNLLTAGTELIGQYLFTNRIIGENAKMNEFTTFAQNDFKFGNFGLIAGLRLSKHSVYNFHASPKISMMYKLHSFTFRGATGLGFRSPTLKEMYMNFDHLGMWTLEGNPNLIPENSKYLSFSTEFDRNCSNTILNVYNNVIDNLIADRFTEDSTHQVRKYENISQARIRGLDLQIHQKVALGIGISGGVSLVEAKNMETKNPLFGSTKYSGNANVEYRYNRNKYSLTLVFQIKYTGEKYYENVETGTNQLDDPFWMLRLTLTQRFSDKYTFTTGIDNLLNQVQPYSYTNINPERKIFIGFIIDINRYNENSK